MWGLHEFSANVATALQGLVRCEQEAVDDGCNSENASDDGTGPESWKCKQPDRIMINVTHEVRKCAKDCLVSECTTKIGEIS